MSYWSVLNHLDWRIYPFDRHGWGLVLDVGLQTLAAPLYGGLLYLALRRKRAGAGPLTMAERPRATLLSWLLLGVIGSPTLAQWTAMRELPIRLSWPVWASAAVWLAVTVKLRDVAARPRP